MKKQLVNGFCLLFVILCVVGFAGTARAADTYSDFPNLWAILSETTNWNLTQLTRLDAQIDCDGASYRANSEDSMIIDVTVNQDSTATVSQVLFNCIKNGRYVVTDRDALPYCQIYVPANSNASLVSIDGSSIKFVGSGDVSVVIKYEHPNFLGLSLNKPAVAVRINFHVVEAAKSEIKLFVPGTEKEIGSFTYACGSYLFDEKDCTKLEMRYTLSKAGGSGSFSYTLVLPDGFSFEPFTIKKEMTLDGTFDSSGKFSGNITVYPIYSAVMPDMAEFSVKGGVTHSQSVPVYAAASEGYIQCRGTDGVSATPSAPINIKTFVNFSQDFSTNPTSFSSRLNELGAAFAFSVYNRDFIENSFRNLGFTKVQYNNGNDAYSVDSAFAQKKIIRSDGTVENLLMVVVRGTVGKEWIGNFVVTDDSRPSEHANFRSATNDVKRALNTYCGDVEIANTQVFVCGHSRGAAVANLLTHDLNTSKTFGTRVRGYTYATPNVARTGVADGNLFNYINLHDFVAFVPAGYFKHGRTYAVGLKDGLVGVPASVSQLFKQYAGGTMYRMPNQPLVIGAILNSGDVLMNGVITKHSEQLGAFLGDQNSVPNNDISQAHSAECYLAWVNGNGASGALGFNDAIAYHKVPAARTVKDFFAKHFAALNSGDDATAAYLYLYTNYLQSEKGGACYVRINSPADVQLGGSATLSVMPRQLVTTAPDEVLAFSIGQSDYLLVPANGTFDVKITAPTEGSMSIHVMNVHSDQSTIEILPAEVGAVTTYTDVSLEQGATWTLRVGSVGTEARCVLYNPEGFVVSPDELPDGSHFPTSLLVIEDLAFMGVRELTGTYFCPEGLTRIGSKAFADSGIEAIYIPASCTTIADDAFEGITPVIYCEDGSRAHLFAQEKGLQVVLVAGE